MLYIKNESGRYSEASMEQIFAEAIAEVATHTTQTDADKVEVVFLSIMRRVGHNESVPLVK